MRVSYTALQRHIKGGGGTHGLVMGGLSVRQGVFSLLTGRGLSLVSARPRVDHHHLRPRALLDDEADVAACGVDDLDRAAVVAFFAISRLPRRRFAYATPNEHLVNKNRVTE